MSDSSPLSLAELHQELATTRQQLQDTEDLLAAIRSGAVDALTEPGADHPRIFTREGADLAYRTLIEQMHEGALLLDAEGAILYANASLAAGAGLPLAALLGSTLAQLAAPADAPQARALVARGWATGSAQGEVSLRQSAGEPRPFALSLQVLPLAPAPVLGVIATDLSAQRAISAIQGQVARQDARLAAQRLELQAQEAARLAGEQAAAEANRMLEGIPQIAWTATPWGESIRFNRRWYDYTGQADAGRGAWHLWAHTHPADVGAAEARWLHSLRTQEPLELECRLRNAAGQYRWMLGRALPSFTEQGTLREWVGTYTDIDEQRQAQLHLQRTNADLDNFIYTASHDLKAPIANIEGLLDALREQLPPAALQADMVPQLLGLMQGAIERFQLTIAHLTEASKLQATDLHSAEQVDLARLVEEVCLDLRPLLASTAARLHLDLQKCPHVYFPAKNLRSLLYNLLSNALKYHHPERPPDVHVRATATAAATVLEVQDNGLGLSPEQQGKLFRMFRRLHDHVEGSGIGLYMAKKMVENAGGTLTLQSEPGVGSTFRVSLPAGAAPAGPAPAG